MKFRRTRRFHRSYKDLTETTKKKAKKAFSLFRDRPTFPFHPSLVVKKMKGKTGVWEGRVDESHRFIFHYETDSETREVICVFDDIGPHDVEKRK